MPTDQEVLCRGFGLMVYYAVGRISMFCADCYMVYESVRALFYNDANVTCPAKVSEFVWFIFLYCICEILDDAKQVKERKTNTVEAFRKKIWFDTFVALLLGLVGQLYIVGACDQPLNDTVKIYLILQWATVAWMVPCLVAICVLNKEDVHESPHRTTPRPTLKACSDGELQRAFDGAFPDGSPALALEEQE